LGTRAVSEVVALLAIIVAAVVGLAVVASYFGGLFTRLSPTVKRLEVYVASSQLLYSGPPKQVAIGYSGSVYFTASYIYSVRVVIHNSGNVPLSGVSYSVVDANPSDSVTIGASDSYTVYDPFSFLILVGYTPPSSLAPNSVVYLDLTVLSKVDLASLGYAPFIVRVVGTAPDGSQVSAVVGVVFR